MHNSSDDIGSTKKVLRLLHEAIVAGNVNVDQLIAAARGKLNEISDAYNGAPLHTAAYAGNIEAATALVKEGADINQLFSSTVRATYWTPLDYAVVNSKLGMVRWLVSRGAVCSAYKNSVVESSLYDAASRGHDEIVLCVLESNSKVHPDAIRDYGKKMLSVAVKQKNVAVMLKLALAMLSCSKNLINKGIESAGGAKQPSEAAAADVRRLVSGRLSVWSNPDAATDSAAGPVAGPPAPAGPPIVR
ncbi:MAG: ankyrin repeat domain-containing protein [Gammaproteobacteria bacterium]|nr:ankyrin repeat domain-containing protein [Gammaproteobacteria bacterium]